MADLVSVVVPVYQVEAFLHRCVDSILAQTHSHLELILVNDGSWDNSGEICDAYARRDRRVTVVNQPNQGLSAARNAGVEVATGKYLTFVDSDDWIHSACVKSLLELCHSYDADISMCAYQLLTEEQRDVPITVSRETQYSPDEALGELMGADYINMVTSWGKLYSAHLFNDIRFPVGRYHEDEFTTPRLLSIANRVVKTDAKLYYYWQRTGSITSSFDSAKRRDARAGLIDRADFLRSSHRPQLSALAYEDVLGLCIKDRRKFRKRDDVAAIRLLDHDLRRAVLASRSTPRSLSFALRAELYALVPDLIDRLSTLRQSLRRRGRAREDD